MGMELIVLRLHFTTYIQDITSSIKLIYSITVYFEYYEQNNTIIVHIILLNIKYPECLNECRSS
jgi:hypothetical protein